MIYDFICKACDLKLTREIIVIVGEKGNAITRSQLKRAEMVLRMIFSRATATSFRLIRNWRKLADQRHLASEEIEDLGRLVEAHAAQEGAHA